MSKSRAYRATEIKNVEPEGLFAARAGQECWVGLDVGKDCIFGVVRWRDGSWERPWRIRNPHEIATLAAVLSCVSGGRRVVVAMESSGTYGDALRQALGDRGVEVHRVSTKRSHDYAEVFDGVPSQHDGKDAAIVAELAAIGKSSPWPYRAADENEQELAFLVDWLDAQRRQRNMWCGRVESLLARHWPEVTEHLPVGSATLAKALVHYGGPLPLAKDAQAAARLRAWGGSFLRQETITAVIHSAKVTLGVRQTDQDLFRLARYASQIRAADHELRAARLRLQPLGRKNPVIVAQQPIVGLITACVLQVHLGDPREYSCGAAYRKAMGLNLKERSSGRWQGAVKISKRGPAQVRRWLYFSALRWTRRSEARPWYEARKKDGEARLALTAMMRKLALALYQVGSQRADFDPARLFPPTSPNHAGGRLVQDI